METTSADHPWGEELREFCRRCLRCCYGTEMILLKGDIERLERLGFRGFYEFRGGFRRLRNIRGCCFFLDPRARGCLAYSSRPLGCRIYPLIYDEDLGAVLDPECPIAGRLPRAWVEAALRDLERFLKALEGEYGYRVDWELLKSSVSRLLSSSKKAPQSA